MTSGAEGFFSGFFDPAAMMEQENQKQMRGADEANQFREFMVTSDRETLEMLYSLLTNVMNSQLMGPMYMGIITGILDQKHGVSMVDGKTDEERLAELEEEDDDES